MKITNQEEFERAMEKADAELIKNGVPLQIREFEILNILCPNSSFTLSLEYKELFAEFEGPNLFEKIRGWYKSRYSRKMLLDFKIGKKPFKLRGEIYYIKYPVILGGQQPVRILNCVEELTDNMKHSLSEDEVEQIAKEFSLGYYAFAELQKLSHLEDFLQQDTKDLLQRGIVDIEAATSIIYDTQNTIFQSHQASEKFLKALLVESNYESIVRAKNHRSIDSYLSAFEHSLLSVYNKLPIEKLPSKKQIRSQVRFFHKLVPSMNIRYKPMNQTIDDAICSVNSMLRICKYVSEQINSVS